MRAICLTCGRSWPASPAATQMIRKGKPRAVIMKELRWKTSRMLDEIYARVTTPDQQFAVKGLWD